MAFLVGGKPVGGDRAFVIAEVPKKKPQGFQPGNKFGGRPRQDFEKRVFANVYFTSECWVWTGGDWTNGYGRIREPGHLGQRWMVHRLFYDRLVGPIPEGLTLDHLCRNRACVRPDHLEPVTRGENTLRGDTITAANRAKTHCPQGHPYDRIIHRPNGRTYRGCKRCTAEAAARARARRVAHV